METYASICITQMQESPPHFAWPAISPTAVLDAIRGVRREPKAWHGSNLTRSSAAATLSLQSRKSDTFPPAALRRHSSTTASSESSNDSDVTARSYPLQLGTLHSNAHCATIESQDGPSNITSHHGRHSAKPPGQPAFSARHRRCSAYGRGELQRFY